MSLEALLAYQDEGMLARSHGLGHHANPFLAREHVPQTTGEPVIEWRQKAEAWLFGWLLENAWVSEPQ
ncbi:MAG: CrpP-related protein [Pseudorhizobium sp.]